MLDSLGRRDEARALLAEIYGQFTEGFAARDLKDARALLDRLADPLASPSPDQIHGNALLDSPTFATRPRTPSEIFHPKVALIKIAYRRLSKHRINDRISWVKYFIH